MFIARSFIVLTAIALVSLRGSKAQPDQRGPLTCRYRGDNFANGDRVPGQTLTCTCRKGRWVDCRKNEKEEQTEGPCEHPDEVKMPKSMGPFPGAQVSALRYMDNFDAEDFVFDFSDFETGVRVDSDGNGGSSQPANINTFPVVQVANMAQTRFRIAPCGINLPHVHPRGTESAYMIEGELTVGFVMESGRTVINDIKADQSTFFPQGLLHYQQNMGCEPAGFISILDSSDPGLLVIAAAVAGLPEEAIAAAFDEDEAFVAQMRMGLPKVPARGRAECLVRCGLPLNTPLN